MRDTGNDFVQCSVAFAVFWHGKNGKFVPLDAAWPSNSFERIESQQKLIPRQCIAALENEVTNLRATVAPNVRMGQKLRHKLCLNRGKCVPKSVKAGLENGKTVAFRANKKGGGVILRNKMLLSLKMPTFVIVRLPAQNSLARDRSLSSIPWKRHLKQF